MYTLNPLKVPQAGESLHNYIKRLRTAARMSQQQLATAAGLHLQSLGKLERGLTERLNQKTKMGLASALSIPSEYLDAVCQGKPVTLAETLKFCPRCWTPGTELDPIWTMHRAKYCLVCGTHLRQSCRNCGEAIASFKHKFCPHCGTPYKE